MTSSKAKPGAFHLRSNTRNGTLQGGVPHHKVCVYDPSAGSTITVVISDDNVRGFSAKTDILQTEIKCKGQPPPACLEASDQGQPCAKVKGLCPCERDTSEIASNFDYMNRMMDESIPLCKAAAADPVRDLKTDPFRFLLIGLGGGTMPMYALARCPAGTQFESVELDPRVVNAATDFLGYKVIDGINTAEINDCAVAVEKRVNGTAKYDVVLVDAFQEEWVPPTCLYSKFKRGIKNILRPGGRVLQHIYFPQYDSALGEYRTIFGDNKTKGFASLGGNVIMADV